MYSKTLFEIQACCGNLSSLPLRENVKYESLAWELSRLLEWPGRRQQLVDYSRGVA
jgi:hypothetical protein